MKYLYKYESDSAIVITHGVNPLNASEITTCKGGSLCALSCAILLPSFFASLPLELL